MSEALKVNTTLAALNLRSSQRQCGSHKSAHQTAKKPQTENIIGSKGMIALCEALKVNTTLESLDLTGAPQRDDKN